MKKVAEGYVEREIDVSEQEKSGAFRKLLKIFELWIGWACKLRARLGLLSSFVLKRLLGGFGLGQVFKSGFGLGLVRSRVGSRRLGFRPDFKKGNDIYISCAQQLHSHKTRGPHPTVSCVSVVVVRVMCKSTSSRFPTIFPTLGKI